MSIYMERKQIYCKDTGERCNGTNYLKTNHWKMKREHIYDVYGGECQRCHDVITREMAHVHHRSYKHMGNENDRDLILYCAKCHSIIHKAKREKKQENITVQWILGRLNKKEKKEALELLKREFAYVLDND